jgi:hypothetical protein
VGHEEKISPHNHMPLFSFSFPDKRIYLSCVLFFLSFFFWVLRVKERGRKNVSLLCLGDGRKWRQLNGEKNFPFGPIKPTLPPFRERMSGKFCSKN